MDDEIRNIEWVQYGVTNLHPFTLIFLFAMVGVALTSRRSLAALAVLATCVLVPTAQRLVVAGLDFNMYRLIAIAVWIRILVRGEHRGLRVEPLDRTVVLWFLSASLFYVLREGSSGIVYRVGVSFDQFTVFFAIRALIRTRSDVLSMWRYFAWITLLLGPLFVYENVALRNPFGTFQVGGFDIVVVRNGRPRAQGPFSHPILAGTFGSVMIPVFVGIALGWKDRRRLFGSACIAATLIVVAVGSSGPVVAWGVGALGWGLWRFRRHTRRLLWTLLTVAVVIHFVREKPIWHLIGRLSSLTGGEGYHRYSLIDAFVRHFSEWALVGTNNSAYWGFGLQDTTNQYVAEGVDGGLVTLLLFIVVLTTCFRQLRTARIASERIWGLGNRWALLTWGYSVSLAAHCVSFISVSYFGQMQQLLYIFLATLPALTAMKRPPKLWVTSRQARRSAPADIKFVHS